MAPRSSIRRLRGAALIEALVAALVMGVCIMGIVSMWSFSYQETTHHEQTSMAYNIARTAIENVKQQGFNYAEYSTGAPNTYYCNSDGTESKTATSASAYKVTISVVSDRLDTNTSTGATRPNESALRTVIVTVRSYPGNKVMATSGTYLARSGV